MIEYKIFWGRYNHTRSLVVFVDNAEQAEYLARKEYDKVENLLWSTYYITVTRAK